MKRPKTIGSSKLAGHSRTRKTLVVKAQCSFSRWSPEEEIAGQILQVPFAKISVEDCTQNFPDRFSVEAAVQDPFVRLSVQGIYKKFPQKISV